MVKSSKNIFPKGKRVNKTFNYSDERVIVKLDLSQGIIIASKQQDQHKSRKVNFLGQYSPYKKNESEKLKQYIISEYCSKNNVTDEKTKEEISTRFDEKVDVGFFKALQNYDMKYNNSKISSKDKSMQYASAMLREVYRNSAESDEEYKAKEISKRNSWLKKAGIELQYELGKKGIFGCKNPLYALKILSKINHTKGLVTVMKDGKIVQSNKQEISEIKHFELPRCLTRKKDEIQKIPLKLKQQKDKVVLKAKGISTVLKQKIKDDNFIKNTKRGLIAAGVIGLVGLSAFGLNKLQSNQTNNFDNSLNQTIITGQILEKDMNDVVNIPEITLEENVSAPEIETNENVATPKMSMEENMATEKVEDEIKEEVVTMSATEAVYGGFDFDTVFTAEYGNFYASPEGTGNSGGYKTGTAYKFNMIKAYNEDGIINLYKAKDGNLDLLQVLEENPNARIAGHVITSDGQIRGWEEDIQDLLIAEITRNMSDKAKAEIASLGLDGDLSPEVLEELKAASENYRIKAIEKSQDLAKEHDER